MPLDYFTARVLLVGTILEGFLGEIIAYFAGSLKTGEIKGFKWNSFPLERTSVSLYIIAILSS